MYRSSPFRSTLNTGYITGLDMCKVCTEAVHSVALWKCGFLHVASNMCATSTMSLDLWAGKRPASLNNCRELAWRTHHNTSWFIMQEKWLCILAWVQICMQHANVCELIIAICDIRRCPSSKVDDALTEWLLLGHFGTQTANGANDPVRVTKMISFKKAAEQHPKGYTMKFRNAIIRRQSAAGARAQQSDWMNIVEALILFSFSVLLRRFECYKHVAIKSNCQPFLLQLEPLLATGKNPSCGIPTG